MVSTNLPAAQNQWEPETYRLILHLLSLTALERNAVALVLQALRSDQALDARSLGVRLLALALGLNLTPDDVLADLVFRAKIPY